MRFSVALCMSSLSKIIDRYKIQQADDLQTLVTQLRPSLKSSSGLVSGALNEQKRWLSLRQLPVLNLSNELMSKVPCYTKTSQDFQPFPIISFRVQDLEEITRNYLPHKKLLELVQRLAVKLHFFTSSSDQFSPPLLSTYEYAATLKKRMSMV